VLFGDESAFFPGGCGFFGGLRISPHVLAGCTAGSMRIAPVVLWHLICEAVRRDDNRITTVDHASSLGVSTRPSRDNVLRQHGRRRIAYVYVLPHWDHSPSIIERFDAAALAFETAHGACAPATAVRVDGGAALAAPCPGRRLTARPLLPRLLGAL
jgi:hypothetical protein